MFVLTPFISQSQIDYINQQELYVKNNIETVQRYSHYNGIDKKEEIWKIDSMGRIIFQEYMPDKWIKFPDKTIWTYNGILLSSKTTIAIWTNKEKQDTAKTIYYYNDSLLLIKTENTNTRNNYTIITFYSYDNERLIGNSIYFGDHKDSYSVYSYDTVHSHNRGKETNIVYSKYDEEFIPTYKTEKEFDNLGHLLKESMFVLSKNDIDYADTSHIDTYIYDNEKLIKIKEEYFSESVEEPNEKYEIIYEYNDQGFVSKILEVDDEGDIFYITYIYK